MGKKFGLLTVTIFGQGKSCRVDRPLIGRKSLATIKRCVLKCFDPRYDVIYAVMDPPGVKWVITPSGGVKNIGFFDDISTVHIGNWSMIFN